MYAMRNQMALKRKCHGGAPVVSIFQTIWSQIVRNQIVGILDIIVPFSGLFGKKSFQIVRNQIVGILDTIVPFLVLFGAIWFQIVGITHIRMFRRFRRFRGFGGFGGFGFLVCIVFDPPDYYDV